MRSCGHCSLCCKIMGVPEVKPRHDWCPHAIKPGGGCRIYAERPQPCRDFHCVWLRDLRFGQHWYPATARIVIDAQINDGETVICFICDPAQPLRWRTEPWFSDIKQIAQVGLQEARWNTVIMVGDERIPVLS